MLSADATAGQISRLMSAGAREYLTKPFDVRQLIGLLEATLPAGELAPAASRPSPQPSTEMRWAPEFREIVDPAYVGVPHRAGVEELLP